MYAIIYVFIFQIVVFNYISMSTQSDSTAVISENIFTSSFNNKKSGNLLKQIINISNSDKGNNPGHKSNHSLIYTTEKIELSERGIPNLLLDFFPKKNCILTSTETLFQMAKSSVKCLINEVNLEHLRNEINEELKSEGSMMKDEMKSLDVSNGGYIGKVFKYLLDLPSKIYNYLYNKAEKFFVKRFMDRFFNKRLCKSTIWGKIKSKVFNTLLSLGGCMFLKNFLGK